VSTKHKAYDASLSLFAGVACTGWTYTQEQASSVIDLGVGPNKVVAPKIWIDIPGLVAGSSGTLILKVYGGTAVGTAATLLWTSRTYTAAEQALIFDTGDGYELPIPVGDLITGTTAIRALKISFTAGTATPTAGVCWASIG
jgi:hypothetical protein